MKKRERPPTDDQEQRSASEIKSRSNLNRYFLIAMLILVTAVFLNVIKIFIAPVILATVFATLFYPLYRWLLRSLRNSRGWSALVCCLILLLGLLIPMYTVANLVAQQAIELYQTAEPKIREIVQRGDQGLLGQIKDARIVQLLRLQEIDWRTSLQEGLKTTGRAIAGVINKTSRGVVELVTTLFVMLFTMFYFFRDGERLVERIKDLSPLDEKYEQAIISRFASISRATVRGTLLIGLIQGTLGAVTFLIFGIKAWVLWGVVMVILSIIPMVGAWLIMIPAAIVQVILGNIWRGVGIFLISTIIISNVDNLLRPRLVGRGAGMHDLLIFFSTLGGISVFGVMGFIIGPVIATLFLALIDIYRVEFKSQLKSP